MQLYLATIRVIFGLWLLINQKIVRFFTLEEMIRGLSNGPLDNKTNFYNKQNVNTE
jgi:hypothetical protein